MPVISYKELLSEDFELRIALDKIDNGFSIKRIAMVVEKDGATFIRWIPVTTTLKLLLINSPDVSKSLRYFKNDPRKEFEIKLRSTDQLRRMIS